MGVLDRVVWAAYWIFFFLDLGNRIIALVCMSFLCRILILGLHVFRLVLRIFMSLLLSSSSSVAWMCLLCSDCVLRGYALLSLFIDGLFLVATDRHSPSSFSPWLFPSPCLAISPPLRLLPAFGVVGHRARVFIDVVCRSYNPSLRDRETEVPESWHPTDCYGRHPKKGKKKIFHSPFGTFGFFSSALDIRSMRNGVLAFGVK